MKPVLVFICMAFAIVAAAQEQKTVLVPDQNPGYMLSQAKYMSLKDSLLLTMNTTMQSTYKAYDRYEARTEQRQDRKDFRRQMRYNSNYSLYYNNGYYMPFNFTPYNRWNSSYFSNRSFIGYRTGNWFFGF